MGSIPRAPLTKFYHLNNNLMEQVAKKTWLEREPDYEKQAARVREALDAQEPYVMIGLKDGADKMPEVHLITCLMPEHMIPLLETVLARAKSIMPGNSN